MDIDTILTVTQGLLIQKQETIFSSIVIDGRKAQTGSLFVSILGNFHDGHQFIEQAISQGATGALVQSGRGKQLAASHPNLTFIEVPDTTLALGKIAKAHRKKFEIANHLIVIGITGSYGKTTTKEMIAAILDTYSKGQVLSTEGNLNNHLGVPLMLLRLRKEHRFAVLELGMSALGEIQYLTSLCLPQTGIITGIGPAHLEQLGSLENIAKAKSELFLGLPQNGTAIFPKDDPILISHLQKIGIEKKKIQFWPISTERIKDLKINPRDRNESQDDWMVQVDQSKISIQGLSVQLSCKETASLPEETFEIHVPLLGFYERNVALAVAFARSLGIKTSVIKEGLSQVKPSKHRSQMMTWANRYMIDDCYNANPESTKAAIRLLCSLPAEQFYKQPKRWMVFGDMLELGTDEAFFHYEIGEFAAQQGIHGLFTIGDRAQIAAQAATKQGLWAKSFDSISELKQNLFEKSSPGDLILLKGSRGMSLERLLEEHE